MNTWFTVKVKYAKMLENGVQKNVSEPYLVAAVSFTDAEARIFEELGSSIKGGIFDVVGIAKTEFHDIFQYDDSDYWYKCKLTYETSDADSEKTKKITQNFLVSASSVKEAYERLRESLKDLMVDFHIPAINLTPIVDIFPYNEELDREISRTPIDELANENNQSSNKVFSASGSTQEDELEEEVSDFENNYDEDEN